MLVAIVVIFALIPAVGLGLSSYTRSAVRAEQQRAADAGALAGAASLVLANPAPLNPTSVITVVSPADALAHAEAVCNTALAQDDQLSQEFATGPSGGGKQCTAELASQTSLRSCVASLLAPLSAIPPVPVPVPVPVPGLPTVPTLPTVVGTTAVGVSSLLQSLLPSLFDDGVTVTVNYRVSGPLDVVLNQNGKQAGQSVATARRRFKAILPDLSTVLPATQQALVTALQQSLAQLQTVVSQTTLPPGCQAAGLEVVSDLQDALQPDPGNTSTNALQCVQQVVFGLDPLGAGGLATVDANCVNQLFRSELTQ